MAQVSKYRVTVKPGPERGETIAAALASVDYSAKFYYFKGREHTLPVVTLPIDLLMYRLANARTQDDQLTAIARGQYSDGFFDVSKQEDVDVQQAQHDILFKFAQLGQGESVVPIYGVLEKEGKQTDPILVTSTGVIVNGNRRVSAMRELTQSPGASAFNHVSCMVLPESATEADLIEIEFKLQMSPETRLPYTWTNEARICKQLRDARPLMGNADLDAVCTRRKRRGPSTSAGDITSATPFLSGRLPICPCCGAPSLFG